MKSYPKLKNFKLNVIYIFNDRGKNLKIIFLKYHCELHRIFQQGANYLELNSKNSEWI